MVFCDFHYGWNNSTVEWTQTGVVVRICGAARKVAHGDAARASISWFVYSVQLDRLTVALTGCVS
jgi:hypothetical protein